jgi:hypothetical protein
MGCPGLSALSASDAWQSLEARTPPHPYQHRVWLLNPLPDRQSRGKNPPEIENARDRSLWRLNLDNSAVQPVLRPPAPPAANFQLALASFLWLRRHRTLTFASALHSSSTGGQLSGSDRFRVLGSTGAPPPAHTGGSAHPFDLRRSIKLAPDDPGFTKLALSDSGTIRLAPNGPSSSLADDLPPTRIECRPSARQSIAFSLRCVPLCHPGWFPPPAFRLSASTLRLHRPSDRSACASRSPLRLSL